MEFDVEEWYKGVDQGDVILSHYGTISANAITGMLDKIEHGKIQIHESEFSLNDLMLEAIDEMEFFLKKEQFPQFLQFGHLLYP